MSKLSFSCDYMEGAHPAILRRLAETNMEKTPGYGLDEYSASAKAKIRDACRCPEAEVFFLVGGTQTNAAVIDAMLRSYQGVIAAESGHVSVHEAGAIEHDGHKVLPLPQHNGKICADQAFCVIENETMPRFSERVEFGFWSKYDDTRTVIRFATSWATTEQDIDALCEILKKR